MYAQTDLEHTSCTQNRIVCVMLTQIVLFERVNPYSTLYQSGSALKGSRLKPQE